MAGRGKGKVTANQRNAITTTTPIQRHKAPASSISNMLEIEKYFNECILDQTTSIRSLSVTLSTLLNNIGPVLDRDESFTPQMITLAGPSGTGKTATVKCLRHFLGMDEGYEFEKQFIEFHTSCSNSTIQYDDMNSNSSQKDPHELLSRDSHDILTRLNQSIENYGATPPPYVLLFIDDYDHTSQASRYLINRLLGNGQYRSTEGSQFVLPKQTALLIVCTCLYGGDDIIKMEERCDYTAKRHISRAMEKYVPTNQCRNLILPYYPLADEILKELLGKKLDSYIGSPRLLKRFGVEVLSSTPEMKNTLIKHVLTKVDKRYGMHGGETLLLNKLDVLFETGIAVIDQMREKERAPIFLESFTFDTSLFGEILDKELNNVTNGDIIRTIKDNPENKQYLAKCDASQNGFVETVGMRCGAKPVSGLIMNVTYVNINNYYDTNETTKLVKATNKKLKACIKAINDVVVQKGSHNMIDDIIKNHQELLHESSDDSGEEAADATRKKKRLLPQEKCLSTSGSGGTQKRKATDDGASKRTLHKKSKTTHPVTDVTGNTSVISEESSSSSTTFSSEEDEETQNLRIDMGLDDFFSLDEDVFSSSEVSFAEVFCSDDEWECKPKKPKKRGRPVKTIPGFKRVQIGSKDPYYQCITCDKSFSKAKGATKHQC